MTRYVFEKMPHRAYHTWLWLSREIAHHAHEGEAAQTLALFRTLLRDDTSQVNTYVLKALLKACGRLRAPAQGRAGHALALKQGLSTGVPLLTALLDMYSRCAGLPEAQAVFREMENHGDAFATNAMITAFCRCGRPSEAVRLFREATTERDVGTWNSLISGLAQASDSSGALRFFKRMATAGERADDITVVSALSACADIAASSCGRQVHCLVVKRGLMGLSLPIGNAIVDMYAKIGSVEESCLCFREMPCKNVITWTSLIVGFGKHGLGAQALRAFEEMETEGIVPNNITFVGVLSACSHAGLVSEGRRAFRTMVRNYRIEPEMRHYGCVVDLLARGGRLEEAWEFIETMPFQPDAELWMAFLSSCLFYNNTELSKIAGERLMTLRPDDSGAYMLLSNIYGRTGDLTGVAEVRRLMMSRGIKKEKAQTWIEIGKTVHAFESGDRSHPCHKEIVRYLEDLLERIKAAGYVINTDVIAHNVDEKMKTDIVLGHSEKLAVGLGLISTPPGTKIVVVKNLRVCADCHAALKCISKVEGREIIARDASRFHRFADGLCSCGDHW